MVVGLAAGFGISAAVGADLYTFEAPAGWQEFSHTNLGNRAVFDLARTNGHALWRGYSGYCEADVADIG